MEAITTTANSRILAIGNPDDRETTFGDVYEEERYDALWHRIRIPADTTPNFTGEYVPSPLPDVLLQRSWVEDRRAAWGEDDARFKSKVLAQFPDNSEFGLFGAPLLARAFVDADEDVRGEGTLTLGVDVARYGEDKSVVAARRGRLCWIEDDWRGMDTVYTAEQVVRIAERLAHKDANGRVAETVEIRVDGIGVGAGVVDTLKAAAIKYERKHRKLCWYTVREMNGSARPPKELGGSQAGYGNARAYWHDQLKHQMRNGRVRLESHEQLADELRACRFRYSSGKMYIESKEEIRSRGGKSPDFSDAIVYVSAPVFDGLPAGAVVTTDPEQIVKAAKREAVLRNLMMDRAMTISPF